MSFDSFGDLLAMGGHALYVWLSYGVTLVVVLANVIAVRLAHRRQIDALRDRQRRLAGQAEASPAVADPVTEVRS